MPEVVALTEIVCSHIAFNKSASEAYHDSKFWRDKFHMHNSCWPHAWCEIDGEVSFQTDQSKTFDAVKAGTGTPYIQLS